MWYILISSPELLGPFVFFCVIVATALVPAILARESQPLDCHGHPPMRVDCQQILSPTLRWSRIDLDRRFLSVLYSCNTDYARIFAHVSEKIRF